LALDRGGCSFLAPAANQVPSLGSAGGLLPHFGANLTKILKTDPFLRATLDNRLHRSPWLFLGKKAGQPMSTYAGQNIYYSALKKSGVHYKGGIHTLRHSFATHLMESGVELPVVQHLLGHSSLRTTALYLHVTARRLAEVRSPLDLIANGGIGQ
jgi:site-specific recombinase XerD